jgi:hypothetical protein
MGASNHCVFLLGPNYSHNTLQNSHLSHNCSISLKI